MSEMECGVYLDRRSRVEVRERERLTWVGRDGREEDTR